MKDRVKNIVGWIVKAESLLSQTNSLKIELSIKGSSVTGQITQYPDSKI
jgi:hypothetical protein